MDGWLVRCEQRPIRLNPFRWDADRQKCGVYGPDYMVFRGDRPPRKLESPKYGLMWFHPSHAAHIAETCCDEPTDVSGYGGWPYGLGYLRDCAWRAMSDIRLEPGGGPVRISITIAAT